MDQLGPRPAAPARYRRKVKAQVGKLTETYPDDRPDEVREALHRGWSSDIYNLGLAIEEAYRDGAVSVAIEFSPAPAE
jgi:monoamine oxidase